MSFSHHTTATLYLLRRNIPCVVAQGLPKCFWQQIAFAQCDIFPHLQVYLSRCCSQEPNAGLFRMINTEAGSISSLSFPPHAGEEQLKTCRSRGPYVRTLHKTAHYEHHVYSTNMLQNRLLVATFSRTMWLYAMCGGYLFVTSAKTNQFTHTIYRQR